MVKSQLTFPSNVGSTGKDHAQSLLRYASKSHRLKEIRRFHRKMVDNWGENHETWWNMWILPMKNVDFTYEKWRNIGTKHENWWICYWKSIKHGVKMGDLTMKNDKDGIFMRLSPIKLWFFTNE